jgi:hypothetical protein
MTWTKDKNEYRNGPRLGVKLVFWQCTAMHLRRRGAETRNLKLGSKALGSV